MRSLLLAVLLLAACSTAAQVVPAGRSREPELSPRNDLWRIHFIDVGQGLAVLHEFPCGAMLVDTGGEVDEYLDSDKVLVAYLQAFFARRTDLHGTLDLLALTHPHIDHTRGIGAVLEHFKVTHAIDNGMDQGSGGTQQGELHDWARDKKIPYFAVERDAITDPHGLTNDVIDPIRCTPVDPTVHALWGRVAQDPGWPGFRFGKTPFQNANNHSVVLRVTFGKASALLTGDLEEPAIRDLLARSKATDVLDVDVYQVGHHGSSNGTIPELVQAMSPQAAVFSMGSPAWKDCQWCGFAYGHPRREIVAMLEAGIARKRRPLDVLVGVQTKQFEPHRVEQAVYGTGWDGTVVVEAEADGRMRVVTTGRR